jgi:hypothetical protein
LEYLKKDIQRGGGVGEVETHLITALRTVLFLFASCACAKALAQAVSVSHQTQPLQPVFARPDEYQQ